MTQAVVICVTVAALTAGCSGSGRSSATIEPTSTSVPVTTTTTAVSVTAAVSVTTTTTTSAPPARALTTSTTRRATNTTTTTFTTTSRAPFVRRTEGLAGSVITIDPGHNGANGSHPNEINRQVDAGGFRKACDTAGTQTNGGYTESAYTFDVADRLVALLRAAGATVVLTREDNAGVGPCVDERAAIGNRAGSHAAVSIHADGGPAGGRGFHIIEPALVKGYTEDIVEPSARLGSAMRTAFEARTGMPVSTYAGRDGVSVRGDLGGLNLSDVPKVFIETGNMRNTTDAALLGDEGFRQRAAEAISSALATFLSGG